MIARKHFLIPLAAGYDHKTEFQPVEYKWKWYIPTLGLLKKKKNYHKNLPGETVNDTFFFQLNKDDSATESGRQSRR